MSLEVSLVNREVKANKIIYILASLCAGVHYFTIDTIDYVINGYVVNDDGTKRTGLGDLLDSGSINQLRQVGIIISKNQALQILYLAYSLNTVLQC